MPFCGFLVVWGNSCVVCVKLMETMNDSLLRGKLRLRKDMRIIREEETTIISNQFQFRHIPMKILVNNFENTFIFVCANF